MEGLPKEEQKVALQKRRSHGIQLGYSDEQPVVQLTPLVLILAIILILIRILTLTLTLRAPCEFWRSRQEPIEAHFTKVRVSVAS